MAKQLLMGNEAFAHAALEAGVRVVAGYPGTPSSELIETIAQLHAKGTAHGVHVEWSTNEKSALELLAGASFSGARCLFTCKQVGLNVASDALMSLNYVGVKGGLVLFVADDPGPISSQTEQDTRRFASFAKLPVFDPATPEQGFEMMKVAFDLSERYHTPVIVRPTTRINHASTFFEIAEETYARPVPSEGFGRDPKWVIFPKRSFEAHGEINERLPKIAEEFVNNPTFSVFNPSFERGNNEEENSHFGIVAGGVSVTYAREALRMLDKRANTLGIEIPTYRFLQIGTPYPFPEQVLQDFTCGLDKVLVLEELDHVLEDELLMFAGRTHATFDVKGRLTGTTRNRGENDVDDIAKRIAAFLGVSELAPEAPPAAIPADCSLPQRPPVLCAGCPHRASFYAVKQALGKTPAVLCGDIGCYTLGNAQPLDAVDTCLCMGAGITMAQGFAVAEPEKKQVAFVGDSTFFASGLPGIVNAVYNNHDITLCVLDNATTAMTGSQPHPGTGVTLMGAHNEPVSIESMLQAAGFLYIVRANPLDLEEATSTASQAIAFEGPSAVLFESPCVQLVEPDAPVMVDTDSCTGCKRCITEIGCPAIGFDATAKGPKSGSRGQVFVDVSLCNGCGLCTQICPFGALTRTGTVDEKTYDVSRETSEQPTKQQPEAAQQPTAQQPEAAQQPTEQQPEAAQQPTNRGTNTPADGGAQ